MNMTILVAANIGIQQSDVPLQQEAPGLIKSGGGKAWDAVASARNDLQREGEQPPDYRQVRGRAAQATCGAASGAEIHATAASAVEAAQSGLFRLLQQDDERHQDRYEDEGDKNQPEHCDAQCVRSKGWCPDARTLTETAAAHCQLMVPGAGLEPARVAQVDFESTASTIPPSRR